MPVELPIFESVQNISNFSFTDISSSKIVCPLVIEHPGIGRLVWRSCTSWIPCLRSFPSLLLRTNRQYPRLNLFQQKMYSSFWKPYRVRWAELHPKRIRRHDYPPWFSFPCNPSNLWPKPSSILAKVRTRKNNISWTPGSGKRSPYGTRC